MSKNKKAEPVIEQINSYEFDERFYRRVRDGVEEFVPSVTYVLSSTYPMGPGLAMWRGTVGNEQADLIIERALEDGSYVHNAIADMWDGGEVSGDDIVSTFKPKRSLKVKRSLQAFLDWYDEFRPEHLDHEYITWNEGYGYAGTVDLKCKIDGEEFLIDFKTSKSIGGKERSQIAAYGLADSNPDIHLALLQLGNTTKKRYTFSVLSKEDIEKYREQFLTALKMFKLLNPNAHPNNEIFPDVFKLPSHDEETSKD